MVMSWQWGSYRGGLCAKRLGLPMLGRVGSSQLPSGPTAGLCNNSGTLEKWWLIKCKMQTNSER